jgi:hypothetical protein
MGAALKVHHLAVVTAGFFSTLAAATTQLLQPWDDARDPVSYVKARDFVRAGEPVERRLPITQLESMNSVHEQRVFALAAIRAGIGGPQMLQDLTLVQLRQSAAVPAERQEQLSEMINRLAALPKTRIRLPGGVQHLLADPIEALLQQTDELNSRLVWLNLAAYVPRGSDLALPNARVLPIDQADVLAHHAPLPVFVCRNRVDALSEPPPSLAFSQLRQVQQRGITFYADSSGADLLPRAQVTMRGGGAYLVTNLPDAAQRSLEQCHPPAVGKLVTLPRRVLS